MKCTYNYQKIAAAMLSEVGNTLSTSKIVELVRKKFPEVKRSVILPGDYCNNHENKDPFSSRHYIFKKRGMDNMKF